MIVVAHEVEVVVADACFVLGLLWLPALQDRELLRSLTLGFDSVVEGALR